MNRRIQHNILFLLLASYVLVGIFGHMELLYLLRHMDDASLMPSKKQGSRETTKTYWTQHKHIPSSFKTNTLFPEICGASNEWQDHSFSILCTAVLSGDPLQFSKTTDSPRAPPAL